MMINDHQGRAWAIVALAGRAECDWMGLVTGCLCLRMVRQKGNAKERAGAHLNVDGSRHVLAGARVLDEEEHAFDGEIKSDAPR